MYKSKKLPCRNPSEQFARLPDELVESLIFQYYSIVVEALLSIL